MAEEHESITYPRCRVSFKKSSSKDGQTGYDIDVSAGCTDDEADVAWAIAYRLKCKADDAVDPAKKMTRELEESVA